MYSVIRGNDYELVQNTHVVMNCIETLCQVINKKFRNPATLNKVLINKCTNIIRDVSENVEFVPKLIPDIEKCILPLLPFLENYTLDVDFE